MSIGKHTQKSFIRHIYDLYYCHPDIFTSSEGTTCNSAGRNHALAGCSPV
jgi:hypothetical protein